MFVTLKTSKNARKGAGMEQVSLSSARQDSARNRFGSSRRDACMACRSKKVRCNGLSKSCDRCIAHQVACVFSSEPRANTRKSRLAIASGVRRSNLDDNTSNSFGNDNDGASIESPVEDVASSSTQHPDAIPTLQQQSHFLNMAGIEGLEPYAPIELETSIQVDPLDAVATPVASSEASDSGLPTNLQQISSTKNSVISPHLLRGEYTDSLFTDKSQPLPDLNTSSDTSIVDSLTPETNPTPDSSSASSCSCIEDILEIVQKLDDDEFKLRTLGFDLVLKLQKWMVFHCCKPLDCPKCLHLPTTSTVILIICNRIANMFQCLSRRIKRQLLSATGLGDDDNQIDALSNTSVPPPFPASTSDLAITINASTAEIIEETVAPIPCNPDMFSPEFECQYSYEERLHMIRVLAKLQVRNFNQLLLRISEMPHSQSNQARADKILDLMNRLQSSAALIDETFGKMIENLMS